MSAQGIGWIGLGAMGTPMAEVLVGRGESELTCFDVVESRVAKLVTAGATAASGPVEVAARSSVVFVMVATGAQLESVLYGINGVGEGLRPGSVVVVMATVGPDALLEAQSRLAPLGVEVVDAPVSGGVRRAAAGDLLILTSGMAAARNTVHPLLGLLARDIFSFGDQPGDAQRVKLVNQLLCGAHIVVAAEALLLAEAIGLDPAMCWQAVRTGAGASFMLDDRGQRMLEPTNEVFSALSIFSKDMRLVTETAAKVGYRPAMAEAAQALFDEAAQAGFSTRDDSTIVDFLRSTRLQPSE